MKYRTQMLSSHGFTLIELLITLAVSGILMAGVYTAFQSQQNSYLAQEQVAETQQNIRAGLDVVIRDIRMAGFDPDSTGGYGIQTATADTFRFTAADFDDDGIDEDITYRIYPPGYGGIALGRQIGVTPINAIAENIEQIEFLYERILNNMTLQVTLDPGAAGWPLNDIRSVQISILARARQPDNNYTHTGSYTTASGDTWTPPNDNLRRRFQITTVNLRNMGL